MENTETYADGATFPSLEEAKVAFTELLAAVRALRVEIGLSNCQRLDGTPMVLAIAPTMPPEVVRTGVRRVLLERGGSVMDPVPADLVAALIWRHIAKMTGPDAKILPDGMIQSIRSGQGPMYVDQFGRDIGPVPDGD